MKPLTASLCALFLLGAPAFAQPHLQGNLSGTYGPGTYSIVGNIILPQGQSMVMQPGTTFLFQGHYNFTIYGLLNAVGTETDSIRFMPGNPNMHWTGMRMYGSANSLGFCLVTGADTVGLIISGCSPTVFNCTIRGNSGPPTWWAGGGIVIGLWGTENTTFSNCVISDNFAQTGAGMLVASNCHITNCRISHNTAQIQAGGIWVDQSNPTFANCTISDNRAGMLGAGIIAYKAEPTFDHCLVSRNSAPLWGGGISSDQSNLTINHCTIVGNGAGRGPGVYQTGGVGIISNTIVADNLGNYAVVISNTPGNSLTYSDFHNNSGGDFYTPPAGVGVLTQVNLNGDSCDVFHNIFEDPLFADPQNSNFQLTWANYPVHDSTMSPCIDAGDPTTLFDPDSTIADMGTFYFPQTLTPQLDITLTPVMFPPPPPGLIMFLVSIVNHGPNQAPFWIWSRIKFPDGSWTSPTIGPLQINPPVGMTVSRQRSQIIPGTWPSGLYYYVGYTNWTYSYPVADSSYFTFTKSAGIGISPFEPAPLSQGETFPGEVISQSTPATFNLCSVSPNPFNPTTVASFELRVPSHVSLKVYDTTGRLVATLVDGWRAAGAHEVTFDGSRLASGLYFVRIKAGDLSAVQKLMLLK